MDPQLAAALQYNLEHAVYYPDFVRQTLRQAVDDVLEGAPVDVALAEAQAVAGEHLAQRAAEAERPTERFTVTGPTPTPVPGGTLIRFGVLEDRDRETYEPLADAFHKEHPEIHVDLRVSSDWRPEVRDREVDCFVGYAGLSREMVGNVLALDPLYTNDPAFDLDIYYLDGTLWGLPLDSDALLLYYNRDRFDQTGEPYPANNWTPQDLVATALALSDRNASPPAYGFYPQHGALVDGASYVAWLGGQLFDQQGYPSFDDSTVVEALTVYADLISRAMPPEAQERVGDRLSGYTVSSSSGSHPDWVQAGHVAMWTDSYRRYASAPPLDNVGVVALPKGQSAFSAPGRALFISQETPYPEACWTWISYLSAQPEAIRDLPVRSDVVSEEAWRGKVGPETANAWQAIAERGDVLRPSWQAESTYGRSNALYWFDEALESVLAGKSPARALGEAQIKAAVFVDCMVSETPEEDTFRACVRQADPSVVIE